MVINIVLNGGGFPHMMDWMDWGHMYWWGIPFMGFWGIWFIQIIIAVFVYHDAEKRGKNGLLWFLLIIIPWIGIVLLIAYLIIRGEEKENKEIKKDALEILNERYAKGEISRKEYIQAKKDIIEKFKEEE